MAHGGLGRGFKLPELPNDAALKEESETDRQCAGDEKSVSLVKPSSFRRRNTEVIPLEAKMLDFYDSVLKEVERLALTGQDAAVVKKVKKFTGELCIPRKALRHGITPEIFSRKAKQLVTLMERIRIQSQEPIIIPAPPTKPKPSKAGKPKVGRLKPDQLKLNIGSTVMCAHFKTFDVHSESESTLGEGRAIPLCIPNDTEWNERTHECKRNKNIERTSLKANPQALRILREISGPVCVLAVVGPCRTGKSYVLGRLISNAGENCQFKLGHKMDPETMGIWMWDRPFKLHLKNGEEVTMVLIDTEGIDAASASDESDNQIFTLSVLISSLLIYNSMTVPRREDLQQMNFVANLSKSIQVQAGKSAEGTEGVQLSDSNPRFMWLLRDVILEPTDKKGRPCHIKDYLLQKVLVPDATDDEYQQRIRQCLLSFFSAFDAETLPPPSTDAHVMRNIENPLYQKDISPHFLQKMEYVRKRILDCCTAKRGFAHGTKVNGFQLAKMVQLYIDALNVPGGVPVVGSTWQRVLEATYETAVEEAVKVYQGFMDDTIVRAPMEEKELLEQHSQALTKSIETFQQAASLDADSTLNESYLNKLVSQLAEYTQNGDCKSGTKLASYLTKNRDKSQEKCAALLHSLREKHLVPLISKLSPEMDFHTIEAAFAALVQAYKEQSVGPAADEMLEEFIKEQEEEQQHLESQLSTIKNYDAEAKQRMAELREQELAIERSEKEQRDLEQKLEQAKKDREAKLKSLREKNLKDQETLRAELEKQHQQQEKRLTSMADANMMKLKKENEEALRNLRSSMESQARNLQARNSNLESEISSLMAQLNRPAPSRRRSSEHNRSVHPAA